MSENYSGCKIWHTKSSSQCSYPRNNATTNNQWHPPSKEFWEKLITHINTLDTMEKLKHISRLAKFTLETITVKIRICRTYRIVRKIARKKFQSTPNKEGNYHKRRYFYKLDRGNIWRENSTWPLYVMRITNFHSL